jgi:cytochrome c-type biogenesis protein CcmH
MTGFVIWAALCAAGAAAFVALPLLRRRQDFPQPQRILGAAAGLLVALSAILLYPQWSNWSWRAASTAPDDVGSDSVAAMLAATTGNPDDTQAWLNLGRAYLRIQQLPLARRSFQHADRLSQGNNAAALSGLAETIVFENNGAVTGPAAALFDRALRLDPHSAQALFYTGVAHLQAGDLATARARFAVLRALGPPAQVVDALDKQIAAIDVEIARLKPDPATAIHLLVKLAPQLAGKVPTGASLFVFVRAPQGGPPLAVKRLSAQLPQQVVLSAADSMIEAGRIKPGQPVQVMARISASGMPTASAGDLSGSISSVAGGVKLHELMIDRQSP